MSSYGSFHGLEGAATSWKLGSVLNESIDELPQILVVAPRHHLLSNIVNDLRFFGSNRELMIIPPYDALPFEPTSPDLDIAAKRNYIHRKLISGTPGVYLTSFPQLLRRILPLKAYTERLLTLQSDSEVSKDALHQQFLEMGYLSVSNVERCGEIALRGGVIDIFPPSYQKPIRIEILGDIVQSLRHFDQNTQRSDETSLSQVEIDPVRERLWWDELTLYSELSDHALEQHIRERAKTLEVPNTEREELIKAYREDLTIPGIEMYQHLFPLPWYSLSDYEIPTIVIDSMEGVHEIDAHLAIIDERYKRLAGDHYCIPESSSLYADPEKLRQHLSSHTVSQLNRIEMLHDASSSKNVRCLPLKELSLQMKDGDKRGHPFQPLARAVDTWRQNDRAVAFVIGSTHRAERLHRIMLDVDLDIPIKRELTGEEWESQRSRLPVVILIGNLSEGVYLLDESIVYVSESEIFGEQSTQRSEQQLAVKKLLNSLSQLSIGDYVVHIDYGIGRYHGFTQRIVGSSGTDLLQIEYADSMLLLPMTNIGKVQRFSALEGQEPKLDKLSSQRWQKTKAKVRKSVETLAGDLVKLYAARSVAKGWRYDPAGASDEAFADGFPYQETVDQQTAITATLEDMASDKPMDRLICGDVGFGKTEIALRAAYKATQHAKQVALLAPTTLLAEQHRQTFQSRFTEFPISIGAISRMYSTQQNQQHLDDIANGKLDVIIGTHKLLQKDIQFHDLGLLIIDEEHRFGVKQKERLKQLKKQVDVLTLTATPIPRTLHMSLLNLRDISIISTPPVDRKSVRTFITPDEESVVRDAVLRELKRGGQSFFLHNRVQNIALITDQLRELIPEARITFAHGQMSERELEKIMRQYIDQEIDLLVCTTIIESGIDIPNANTILIHRADALGLAQLYQLRGRVGRSHQQAYCYFLIPKKKRLTGQAQERLRALQSLDELGIGFQLAVRDLEIRGAGNLLGKEQSGSVLAVGFDLYTRILEEAIHHLTGEELALEKIIEPEIKIDINAYIPEVYIPDMQERMVLYQRLSSLTSEEESADLQDEMVDRFGPLDEPTNNLLALMNFRGQLKKHGVLSCECSASKLHLTFSQQAPVSTDKILQLIQDNSEDFRLGTNNSLTVTAEKYLKPASPKLYRDILMLLDKIAV